LCERKAWRKNEKNCCPQEFPHGLA
jgi:hypothetical protein